MPEIKHNFSAGKMNKDLDERLVPNGEYRNALNIQVKTTDGDSNHLGDAGTVQNLKGNYKIGSSQQIIGYDGKKSEIIGSVSDDATNSAYFFTAAPVPLVGAVNLWPEGIVNIDPTDIDEEIIWSDSIMRVKLFGDGYDVRPIIVDRFAVTNTKAGVLSCDTGGDIDNSSVYKSNGSFEPTPTNGYDQIQVLDGTKYRIGMRIYAQTSAGTNLFSDGDNEFVEILQISSNILTLSKQQTTDLNTATAFKFVYPERVLEFDYHKEGFWQGINTISAIHVLDDLLMWTDGKHEPKKINIERCRAGTPSSSYSTHTQLMVKHPLNGGLVPVSDLENLSLFSVSSDIKKEDITTIKIAPTSPPNITMKEVDRESTANFPLVGYEFVIDNNGDGTLDNPPKTGDLRSVDFPTSVDFRLDDIYTFTAENTVDPITIRAKIIDIDENNPGTVTIELLLVDSDLSSTQNPSSWSVELEKREPLFEAKFGRFAYRYQYEDNEYSTFSPWSELVFLPGDFLYTPNKGFNEGMANTVRQLIVKDFIPNNYIRPHDVKSIDILWKTTDNSNVYIVKTIVREIDTEWKNFSDSIESNTGLLAITSEMIYKVVEANQLLRSWDNVPRNAVAQEITGNRLLYGNYKQGYDIDSNIGLKQTLVSDVVSFPKSKKSVKSLRTYQFGIVIGDRYGRETPVISNGYQATDGQVLPGASKVSKSLSKFSNKFKLKQSWDGSNPTDMKWMDYIKYYVKETSNEYYNLVLDRWYDGGDNNIWLSFNSADRNKVDEETYLILKNEHGGQGAVEEEAKYKILSIENEAPDYIKTDNREFDLVQIDSENIYGANWPNTAGDATVAITDAVPSALIDNKKIKSANLNLENLEFKGTPKVRIVAKFTTGGNTYEAKSPIKTVSRIINEDEDKSIVIRNTFNLGEVNMYQKILTQLLNASDLAQATADTNSDFKYYIQLIDAVVENKAQFDGKFFVKVANDSALQERILGNSLGEYEVLNSYQIAYIANESTNPSQVSEYASEMDYEASGWDSYNDSDIFTNSNITNFGPNDSNTTENFWINWYESTNRTADIFIDQAPAFSGFNLQSDTGQDALPNFNSGQEPINTDSNNVTNWQPQGLSNGTYEETVWNSDNNMGQLTFSMIGGVNNAMWNGTNSYFKTKMQSQGTLFRFRDDPNQEVYRVFQSSQSVDAGGVVPAGPINIPSKNFDNDGTSDYVDRETIIVRFQRLDNNGNSTGSGLDASVWDPRGTIKHNGFGSLTIEFVQRTQVQNLSDDSISSNSACFETEPKEDVGLDIYYEASGAIPIRLSQRYIQTFTGPNKVKENASSFTVDDRKLVNGQFEKVNLETSEGELPWVYQTIGSNVVHIKRDLSGISTNLKTIITANSSDGICAAIDDTVSFKNLSGLVTKSKILDHVKLLNTGVAVPSDRATFSNAIVNFFQGGNYIQASGITNNINGQSIIGAEVTGDGLEKGTFIVTTGSPNANSVILSKKPVTAMPFVSDITIKIVTGYFEIEKEVWQYPVELGWFNCYSFGNGVESDRIRDDFNAPQIDNGVKASSTFLEYGEENKTSSMIYSGLYNSTSGVNNLNQFIQAEKITKDLNTIHGSIQAMKTRDNDVVVFTEDKVLKVMSSGKDAVFNADNKPQLTATDAVLGTAMPFTGDYGISKNPESLAFDSYRMYFTDMQRGAVLRLSGNGITPISDVGMKNYFRENLKKCDNLIGSFDNVSDEYNLTLDASSKWQFDSITASFSEGSKGWVSFKSFIPLTAISVNDKYFSVGKFSTTIDLIDYVFNCGVYVHYSDDVSRNNFYETHYNSEVEVLFNESPGTVKSFTAINYEGSQAKIQQFTEITSEDVTGTSITVNDGEYYNIFPTKTGWYVDSIETNLQTGAIGEFIEKENKWFNKISGDTTTKDNLDTSEFTVQGIGFPLVDPTDTQTEEEVTVQGVDSDNNPL